MQPENPHFCHYKNGIYDGFFSNNRRQGVGLLLMDSSVLIIGQFKSDQLSNTALIWLSYDTYFLGQFNKGAADGPFVIRSPTLTIYSSMDMNSLSSDLLIISKKQARARLWNIENSEGVCAKQTKVQSHDNQSSIIKNMAPYVQPLPTAAQFLKKQMGKVLNIYTVNSTANRKQYQLNLKGGSAKKLTFRLLNEELLSCGVTEDGVLSGLGFLREASGSNYLEGQFSKGKLHGQGVKQDQSRALFGTFNNGDIRSLNSLSSETQSAKSLLMKLKKKMHIHALEYFNSYVNERPFLLIIDLYRLIEQQQELDPQYQDQEKTKQGSHQGMVLATHRQSERWSNFAVSSRRREKMDELAYNLEQYNVINNLLKYRK